MYAAVWGEEGALGWRETGLAILAPLAGEEGEDEDGVRCLGRLSSMDLWSWEPRGDWEEEEEREDWDMFEIVLLGMSLALGESSVRLALRTGGCPVGTGPHCTPASRRGTSSCLALSNSSCSTPQFSLSSPIMSVI